MTKLIWTKAELSANGGHTPECEDFCHDSCPIGQERRAEANARAAEAQKLWHERGSEMIEHAYIGPRKRTEKTAMEAAKREGERWWKEVGSPHTVTPIRARRIKNPVGWIVDYTAEPKR